MKNFPQVYFCQPLSHLVAIIVARHITGQTSFIKVVAEIYFPVKRINLISAEQVSSFIKVTSWPGKFVHVKPKFA